MPKSCWDGENSEELESLLGKVIVKIEGMEVGSEEITITTDDGWSVKFWHEQDCCESCSVNEVIGDPQDLIGSPLLKISEDSNENSPPEPEYHDSWTWTFYRFATIKGEVTLRWLGESNGYYSESVTWSVKRANE